MATDLDLARRVHDRWCATEVEGEPVGIACDGASEGALDSLEARYELRLPPELRALYLLSDGTASMDESEITFWPIDVIESHHASAPGTKELCFADFRLGFGVFAVDLGASDPSQSPVYVHAEERALVARSFSDFLERYLEQPSLLVKPARS